MGNVKSNISKTNWVPQKIVSYLDSNTIVHKIWFNSEKESILGENRFSDLITFYSFDNLII
jgi:hypothetical protein